MNAIDLMKCADLAAHLGHILEVNPVWKDGYAIFDDEPLAMVLAIDTGRWKIATGYAGVLNLPACQASSGDQETEDEQGGKQ